MLDSETNVYNINDDNPLSKTVEVTDDAVVEGYMNIYLGEEGTGLKNTVIGALSQDKINETLSNLKFTLKHDINDTGTELEGGGLFIQDENGNLGANYGNGIVKGKFRIYTQDLLNTILEINRVGYLEKDFNITLNNAAVYSIGSDSVPFEMYCGDVATIQNRQLIIEQDKKISNVDFSGWLTLYNKSISNTATADELLIADFSKDGVVDNIDFSLWLAAFKKVLIYGN
jgi:hypothetical protein